MSSEDEEAERWAERRLKARCPFCFNFARFCSCRRVHVPSAIAADRNAPVSFFEWSIRDHDDAAAEQDHDPDDDWDPDWPYDSGDDAGEPKRSMIIETTACDADDTGTGGGVR